MRVAHIYIGIIVLFYLVGFIINLNFLVLFKDFRFEYYQLLTYSFLHGGLEHLLFNSIALLQVGVFLERDGFISFTTKWVLFAVFAGITSYFIESASIVGASGVIMGMLAYCYMRYNKHYDMSGLFVLIILNILIGLLPGISFGGHLGGAVAGFGYYYIERIFVK